ncbi:MAG: hypothetical protein M1576_00585 [Deltaproteobacteria bacterium]|nr:hypothetical protein [Deltaproteobacteria bacterium]MCL5673243.1 hypothetical protein [Deltaproteobacteria bacterium]
MVKNASAESEEKPLFLLLAGSNGAGKSTYIKSEDFKDVLNVLKERFGIMPLKPYKIINHDIILELQHISGHR